MPAAWNIRLADLNVQPLSGEELDWCDLVMVSGMIVQREGVREIIREAGGRGKVSVCGGPYASAAPEELLSEGCDLVDPRAYSGFVVQASRGCPHGCEFCDIAGLYGDRPRYKRSGQLMQELENLHRLGTVGFVFICDDNFIGNRRRALETLRGLIDWNARRGRPFGFQTQASLNLGRDPEMIEPMAKANVKEVFIGIETPDRNVLTRTRKLVNTRHPMLDSLSAIIQGGISVQASFIMGFDHEMQGAGKRICDFVEAARIPIAMLNVLNAPPGTPLWDRLEAEGRLLKNRGTGESTLTPINFVPTRPESEIMEEYVGAWKKLYEPTRYLERAGRLCLALSPQARWRSPGSGPPMPGGRSRRPTRAFLFRRDAAVLFRMAWELGLRPPYRAVFWRHWFEILLKNPSRLRKYAITAIMGLDLFDLREQLLRRSRTASGSTAARDP